MPPAGPFSAAIGAAAFWMFIAIVVAVSILSQALKHRETQKTIRQAIDKGQTLDPATVTRMLEANGPPPPSRIGFIAGGLVLVGIGVGFALMGMFVSMQDPRALYPMLGLACLITMIGVPLLIASFFVGKRNGDGRG
ncbi:MAG TPA: DUF6249 domain-containing protein [Caulobacteraceae bacterium]